MTAMVDSIEVRIDSSRPIFITASADDIGAIFARMSGVDQIAVLEAMVKHMSVHPLQWDYISIALDQPVNRELRDRLRSVLFPPEEV
ncbi:hypothetical protein HFO71_24275 [Rhizobium laguerreae]|uniref:hypothetical protein n=1 Tax=Rhizobium laguerreae TaxID=1076926 RepID=UPI001C918399|nr:hypothetical protein [Rhizobium laguerreae]MBY3073434.1 hypothetical protein [Rhizobium laguerreae]